MRSAEARLGRDLASGRASAEPVREVVSRPAPSPKVPAAPKVPTKLAGWTRMLDALSAQLREGELGRQHWTHAKLLQALLDALSALDKAAPGGLDRIPRH